MAKKSISTEAVLSEDFLMRLEDDAWMLEHYLLNDMQGWDDFTCNGTVNYVEELFGKFPEELTPLVIALRKVRAKVIAKAA